MTWQLASRMGVGGCGRSCSASYYLVLEVTYLHFCHVLFMCHMIVIYVIRVSLSAEEENWVAPLEGRIKEFVGIFKNPYTL